MSELPDRHVKLGYWVDSSYGSIIGATITTTIAWGNAVLALLVIVVSLGAYHLWNLLMFLYYQYRVSKPKKDKLFEQQQVLLRTLPSPDTLLVDFIRLSWHWRTKSSNTLLRCLFPCTAALIYLGASVAAGIFSSLAITTNNLHVLVDSPGCGFPVLRENSAAGVATYDHRFNLISEYSQACSENAITPSSCHVYVKPRIPFSSKAVKCPFSSSICIGGGDIAVVMDTGLLDSNDILGINAKPNERVKVRHKVTCAPIRVQGRYNVSEFPEVPFREHLLGEQGYYFLYGNPPYILSTYTANVTRQYILRANWHFVNEHNPRIDNYKFIPELQRSDADTLLFFILPNNVVYLRPTDDPVFLTKSFHAFDHEWWRSAYPAGVIGCTEQTQYCISTDRKSGNTCTELGGQKEDLHNFLTQANEIQKSTVELFAKRGVSMSQVTFSSILQLKAANTLSYAGLQVAPLPPDQWRLEVEGWFNWILFALQDWPTQYAQGLNYNGTLTGKKSIKPTTAGEEYLCRSIKMTKSGGFANINVFGFSFTLAVSALFIVLDIAILKGFIFLKKVRKVMGRRIEAWVNDGVLHLQRMAYETRDFGDWVRLHTDIPVITENKLKYSVNVKTDLDI